MYHIAGFCGYTCPDPLNNKSYGFRCVCCQPLKEVDQAVIHAELITGLLAQIGKEQVLTISPAQTDVLAGLC